jgi:hypothetical protein
VLQGEKQQTAAVNDETSSEKLNLNSFSTKWRIVVVVVVIAQNRNVEGRKKSEIS